jgi:uncharacterized alpha-E superfamily protein
MLSRVAENIYWMARYIERAENTARLITVNTALLLDLPKHIAPGWEPLIAISGAEEPFFKRYKEAGERQVTKFMIADDDNPGSILNALAATRENCRTIRDIIPREAWEKINEVYLFAKNHVPAGLSKRGRVEYLEQIIDTAQTITGLLAGTMNHDAGYQFLRIGRNLERADMTSRIIDVRTTNLLAERTEEVDNFDNTLWMSVLRSLSAYQMYRRTMQVNIRRGAVLSFLFRSKSFPRSLMHCISEIKRSVDALGEKEDILLAIDTIDRLLVDSDVGEFDPIGLHEFVDRLQLELIGLHSALVSAYFLPVEELTGMVQVQT